MKQVFVHYKDEAYKSVLGVLGSVNIIGNPVSLGKSLFKGVYDLFDKPMTGFVKGPIEGALGLCKGVGCMVKYKFKYEIFIIIKFVNNFRGI